MEYIIDKAVKQQVLQLMRKGGQYQRAAESAKKIFGAIKLEDSEPFNGVPLTNHGESRIKHCIKYDLSGFCRLITIQNQGKCFIKFLGTHDDCDKWLNANRGLNIAVDTKTGEAKDVFISINKNNPDERIVAESDYSEGKLFEKLGDWYFDKIAKEVDRASIRKFEKLDSISDEDEILELCKEIPDKELEDVFFDAFISLKAGDVDSAKNRIRAYLDELGLLEKLPAEELNKIVSNDQYLHFEDMDPWELKTLMENHTWHDWMLFMHPAQKVVVDADYNGPARLMGVSGSGKTCVIVRRAVRLANKYPGEKILILTLNRSLALLIKDLIKIYVAPFDEREALEENINVYSYWELCREYLLKFDTNPLAHRMYNDFVEKHNENIDEAWEKFYRCMDNNNDADVLFPMHQTLLLRGVYPQDYIRQEFDWIRSAFIKDERHKYLDVDREGRTIPIAKENRQLILDGLKSWEEHMAFIGMIDYLGLSQKVMDYIDQITSEFRCILVDEVQDFGTIELKAVRKLAAEAENDLFLCGDIAQVVHTKHHKITHAGVNILPKNFLKINKNYRNSREILAAAYEVFKNNTSADSYKMDGFNVLDPEFANFSTAKPFLRKTSSLKNSLNFSLTYLEEILDESKNEKGCIAICGYSYFDIQRLGQEVSKPVLDGKMDLSEGNIFLSDLENTKGFEFDRMLIINCNKNVIPNPEYPEEEWFREISKFYVAMTRAKKELILTYHDEISGLFDNCREFFTEDNWVEHLEVNQLSNFDIQAPTLVHEFGDSYSLKGKDFLYTKDALGIPTELQNKLVELVNGQRVSDEKNRKLGWPTIGELKYDATRSGRDLPHLNRLFGPTTFEALEKLLKKPRPTVN